MVKRLKDRRGEAAISAAQGDAGTAFGWVKQVLGFRQFSLRGLKKVQGEWSLVTLALNLRRMAAAAGTSGKMKNPTQPLLLNSSRFFCGTDS